MKKTTWGLNCEDIYRKFDCFKMFQESEVSKITHSGLKSASIQVVRWRSGSQSTKVSKSEPKRSYTAAPIISHPESAKLRQKHEKQKIFDNVLSVMH